MRIRSGRWWLLPLATILGSAVLGTAFVAEGLNNLLTEPATSLSDAGLAAKHGHAARSVAARHLAERVLARNIFDSSTGPLSWNEAALESPVTAPASAPAPTDAAPPARCNQNLRLVASV